MPLRGYPASAQVVQRSNWSLREQEVAAAADKVAAAEAAATTRAAVLPQIAFPDQDFTSVQELRTDFLFEYMDAPLRACDDPALSRLPPGEECTCNTGWKAKVID